MFWGRCPACSCLGAIVLGVKCSERTISELKFLPSLYDRAVPMRTRMRYNAGRSIRRSLDIQTQSRRTEIIESLMHIFDSVSTASALLSAKRRMFVHGQVTIIFVVPVGLSVCLCRVFLSRR